MTEEEIDGTLIDKKTFELTGEFYTEEKKCCKESRRATLKEVEDILNEYDSGALFSYAQTEEAKLLKHGELMMLEKIRKNVDQLAKEGNEW